MPLYFNMILLSYWLWDLLRNVSSQQVRICVEGLATAASQLMDLKNRKRQGYLKLATFLNCVFCLLSSQVYVLTDVLVERRGNEFLHISWGPSSGDAGVTQN